jgi:hypothetical protein
LIQAGSSGKTNPPRGRLAQLVRARASHYSEAFLSEFTEVKNSGFQRENEDGGFHEFPNYPQKTV